MAARLAEERAQNLTNSYKGGEKGSANSAIIHTKLHQDVRVVRSSWCDEQYAPLAHDLVQA